MNDSDNPKPALLSLPREIRDQILNEVVVTQREAPASPSVSQDRVPYYSKFDSYWTQYKHIYVEKQAPKAFHSGLLYTNWQLRKETLDAIHRRRASEVYVLDVMFVDHLGILPTWLSWPGPRRVIEHVHIQVRLFEPPPDISIDWLKMAHVRRSAHASMQATNFSLMSLLTDYLLQTCATSEEFVCPPSICPPPAQPDDEPSKEYKGHLCDGCPNLTVPVTKEDFTRDPEVVVGQPFASNRDSNGTWHKHPRTSAHYVNTLPFSTIKHITINVENVNHNVYVYDGDDFGDVFGFHIFIGQQDGTDLPSAEQLAGSIYEVCKIMGNGSFHLDYNDTLRDRPELSVATVPRLLTARHIGVIDIFVAGKHEEVFNVNEKFFAKHERATRLPFTYVCGDERPNNIFTVAEMRRRDGLLLLEPGTKSEDSKLNETFLLPPCGSPTCWGADRPRRQGWRGPLRKQTRINAQITWPSPNPVTVPWHIQHT